MTKTYPKQKLSSKLFGRFRFWWGECVYLFDKARYTYLGGVLVEKVMAIDGGHASEIGYFDRDELVGYCAFGHFDPSMSYIGQKRVKVTKC